MKRNIFKSQIRVMLLCLCFIVIKSNGQNIKVINATSQGWAGGVCCIHGTNYNFSFKIKGIKQPIFLDTLWIDGYCHSIDRKIRSKKDTIVSESYGITINDHDWDYNGEYSKLPCHDFNIKGRMLVYRINKKRYTIDLSPHIKELEFIAYP